MMLTVNIQPAGPAGYRASCGARELGTFAQNPIVSAAKALLDQGLAKLNDMLDAKLPDGASFVPMQLAKLLAWRAPPNLRWKPTPDGHRALSVEED